MDDDLERELRSHLECEIEEQSERGLSADEAQHAAHRAFGNATQVKEELREMRGWVFFDRLKQDVAYAVRGMRRNPGFTIAVVVSLALGIGAITAIFTLINAVMLRSLPVPDPQELLQLVMTGASSDPMENFSYPLIRVLTDHREIFSHLCGSSSGGRLIVGRGDSLEAIVGLWVTGEYYQTMEVQPEAGRLLTLSDDRPGASPVAVITDGYWQRKFARNPHAIGQPILIEGKLVTIVGVTPAGFAGANVGQIAEITMPVGIAPQLQTGREYMLEPGAWWLRVLARPRSDVSRARMQTRLDRIWRSIPQVIPETRGSRVEKTNRRTVSGGAGWSDLRRQFRKPLLVLMAVTGLLLMIACANVANLLLARAAARRREFGVRMAIGAGRARVIRQLLTESVLLSIIGALLGAGLAWTGSRVLVSLLAGGRANIVLDVAPDLRVLAFTAAASFVPGILIGLAPAFQGTAFGPANALRDKIGRSRSRIAPLLVAVQLSLTLLLLIGAGLFVGTLRNLQNIGAGFRTNGVFLINADGSRSGYQGPQAAEFYVNVLEKIERLPGVAAASFAQIMPLAGGGITQRVAVNGVWITQEEMHFNGVSRRYFETMGTPVLLGRDFTRRDNADGRPVAIVNELFAKKYLHGGPLGQRLTVGGAKTEFEVVGVVRDSVYESLREPAPPTVFVPVVQRARKGWLGVTFEVHASGSLAQVASALRKTVQPLLPDDPVVVRTLAQQADSSLVRERLMATLAGSFGVLGLVLAVVGLYGLLAYTVTGRTSEIGVRMALGATQQGVLYMVMRNAVVLLGAGVAIGLPAAWAASRLVSSMLFGLTATDAVTIGAATGVLLIAGILAGLPPAWRASHVDPMTALRYE